ncbi:hypothetical protein CCMA1212_006217 [Trichoderma ghanense]|uniref:Ankyrin repeat protein n=1 Tax=Trichoderma ghanense TaxID=65468 RepID=A0ABY2H0K0_9HYPO
MAWPGAQGGHQFNSLTLWAGFQSTSPRPTASHEFRGRGPLAYAGDAMICDKAGKNALHWVAQFGHVETLKAILERV